MTEPGGPFLEEQERQRKIEEETLGGALRKIQSQLNEVKGAILAALGDRALELALWLYNRSGGTIRVSLPGDQMVSLRRRPNTGNAELDRLLDRVDAQAEAFFRANPGASTMLNIELGSPGSARYVSEVEWPAVRQKLRDNVAALAEGKFL